jgi:glycosyltransferase involved in cell wall biosynthesis
MIRKIQPAILQTWLYHADLLGTVASIFGGRPSLVWNLRCSDMDLAHYPATTRLTLQLLAFCSRVPKAVIVNSQAGQRFHEAIGYRARKWEMIPNGFDLAEFRPDQEARIAFRDRLGIPHDATLIGMVARLDPMKDHATFLEAARTVAGTHENVFFILVGHGVESLISHVHALGLDKRVHLFGLRGDVPKIMPALDICSLTSAFGEGFPNVVGEAMACAVPCVVTDVGDSAFLVGEAGRVVPPRNPELLARRWLELIEMGREKRLRLGAVSRERIRAHFDLVSVVKRYEQCYEELAAQSSVVGHGLRYS